MLAPDFVVVLLSLPAVAHAEPNAALHYWLAFADAVFVPEFVASSTTDDPELGFAKTLTPQQLDFLDSRKAQFIDRQIALATAIDRCEWERDSPPLQLTARTEQISLSAHAIARVVLLHARRDYESGRWSDGHDHVLRTMRMARDVAKQIHVGENYTYMIENMARATAAAYLPEMPVDERRELAERVSKLPLNLPSRDAHRREAATWDLLANELTAAADSPARQQAILIEALQLLLSVDLDQATFLAGERPASEQIADARVVAQLHREVGDLLTLPLDESDTVFAERVWPRIQECKLARLNLAGETPKFDPELHNQLRREDGQNECRAKMFLAAIDVLEHGPAALANHPDPYGAGPFGYEQRERGGFRLTSLLRNHSPIDLIVGRDVAQH